MGEYPEFFQQHRLEKRNNLLDNEVNPYPYSFTATHTINDIIDNFDSLDSEGASVSCAGRILSVRKMGKSWFVDLIDKGKQFQLNVHIQEATENTVKLVPYFDIGDWAGVTGKLFKTKTGQPTILVKELQMLGKSVADVPFGKIHDGTTSYTLSNIEVRRQQRYLDWITDPESVETVRTQITDYIAHPPSHGERGIHRGRYADAENGLRRRRGTAVQNRCMGAQRPAGLSQCLAGNYL